MTEVVECEVENEVEDEVEGKVEEEVEFEHEFKAPLKKISIFPCINVVSVSILCISVTLWL